MALTHEVVGELLAQLQLVELAGRRERNRVDEDHVLRQPPFGHFALQEAKDILLAYAGSGLALNDEQGALVPLGMAHTDRSRIGHADATERQVLELDGADPLAAGLDHVLAAICDLHVAIRVDRCDVSGWEPSVHQRRLFGAEVVRNDPGTANQKIAEGFPVVRQWLAVRPDDFDFHAEHGSTLFELESESIFLAEALV